MLNIVYLNKCSNKALISTFIIIAINVLPKIHENLEVQICFNGKKIAYYISDKYGTIIIWKCQTIFEVGSDLICVKRSIWKREPKLLKV
jgi:hypothetical protein